MTNQKLYAMRDLKTGYIKIGISKHPQVRAYHLSSLVSSEVTLLMEQEAKNAKAAEKFAHRQFEHKNVRGEWFALDEDDLAELTSLFDAACDLRELPKPDVAFESTGQIKWKLKEFLDAEGVTAYALAQKTSEKLSQKGVYRLTQNDLSGIRFESLQAIIPALRDLTGKAVQVSDLLEYADA